MNNSQQKENKREAQGSSSLISNTRLRILLEMVRTQRTHLLLSCIFTPSAYSGNNIFLRYHTASSTWMSSSAQGIGSLTDQAPPKGLVHSIGN